MHEDGPWFPALKPLAEGANGVAIASSESSIKSNLSSKLPARNAVLDLRLWCFLFVCLCGLVVGGSGGGVGAAAARCLLLWQHSCVQV